MIDPRYMDVVEWTDRMAQILPFTVSRLLDEALWQDWAFKLVQEPQIAAYNPPSPAQFTDWREWAERLNQVVPLN